MFVHFPIALLLAAFASETLALAFNVPAWRRISLWNLVLGTWGALAAAVTGGISAAAVTQPPGSRAVLMAHTVGGCLVLGVAGLVTAWRLSAEKQMDARRRWICWALLGVACVLTAYTGHLGGRLVFEFDVVPPQELARGIPV